MLLDKLDGGLGQVVGVNDTFAILGVDTADKEHKGEESEKNLFHGDN